MFKLLMTSKRHKFLLYFGNRVSHRNGVIFIEFYSKLCSGPNLPLLCSTFNFRTTQKLKTYPHFENSNEFSSKVNAAYLTI